MNSTFVYQLFVHHFFGWVITVTQPASVSLVWCIKWDFFLNGTINNTYLIGLLWSLIELIYKKIFIYSDWSEWALYVFVIITNIF